MAHKTIDKAIQAGLLSIGQVCKLTELSRTIIQRWVDNKYVESFNIPDANDIRINANSLYLYLLQEGYPVTHSIKQAADNYRLKYYQNKLIEKPLITPSNNHLKSIFPVQDSNQQDNPQQCPD